MRTGPAAWGLLLHCGVAEHACAVRVLVPTASGAGNAIPLPPGCPRPAKHNRCIMFTFCRDGLRVTVRLGRRPTRPTPYVPLACGPAPHASSVRPLPL